MPIEVVCQCGTRFRVPDERAGLKGRCFACGSIVAVPVPRDPARDCPFCGYHIDPPPRARRKCPGCREWINVTKRGLMTPADARRQRAWEVQCRVASEKLLPCLIIGPPGKVHVLRPLTEFMPPEPPDHLLPDFSNIEIDGGTWTMGPGFTSKGQSMLEASIRAGTWKGPFQVLIDSSGRRVRKYHDGRVEVDELPDWWVKMIEKEAESHPDEWE